ALLERGSETEQRPSVPSVVDGSQSLRRTVSTVSQNPTLDRQIRSLSILVAEDKEFNAQFMEALLVRRGHRVRITRDGIATLAAVRAEHFDLLLLDVYMPKMDGCEVSKAIRADEVTTGRHLPMIALTARSRREDRDQCLASGMDQFLTKPLQATD